MSAVRSLCWVLVLLAVLINTKTGWTQEHTAVLGDPILRIETGSHASDVRRIGVNDACTIMVTGSYDKTIRLWALPGHPDYRNQIASERVALRPTLLKTLRLPIDSADADNNRGKVYAVAMSPNGDFFAAGGWLPSVKPGLWSVYVFDTASGNLIYQDNAVPHRINHLTVSADGRYLAATLHGRQGVVVWETTTWKQIRHDDGYQDASYGAAFDDKTGTLYTTSFDGHLRAYGPGYDFSRVTKRLLKTGRYPYQVAINSQSNRLAIGYGDSAVVDIFSTPMLEKLDSPKSTAINNAMPKIAWSRDGQKLYGGGTFRRAGMYVIREWNEGSDGEWRDLMVSRDFVTHLQPCSSGVAFAANDPAFGVIDENGDISVWMSNSVPNMKEKRHGHLTVSEDGTRVRFGLGPHSRDPVIFDLRAERLFDAPALPADLYAADEDGIAVENWEDVSWGQEIFPALDGRRLGRTDYLRDRPDETARSFATARDGRHFVIGTEWSLRYYDRNNIDRPLWEKQLPGDAWAANITKNRKLVVVSHGDGTIRWYRTSDGTELLALLVDATDKRWIAWSGNRFFMSSIGAEGLLGWHVNQPGNLLANFYEAFRFRNDFYRPDIVRSVLDTMDLQKSIDSAVSAELVSPQTDSVASLLPPSIEILKTIEPVLFEHRLVTLPFRIHEVSDLRVSNVIVQVDGVTVNAGADIMASNTSNGILETQIRLPRRDVTVTLTPYSGYRVGVEDSIKFKWTGSEPADSQKPKLYGLAMGFSRYRSDALKLRWAATDAKDFKKALEGQKNSRNPIFREIADIRILTDESQTVDRGRLLDEFTELQNQIGFDENVVTVVFYSGHGFVGENRRFFLMPVEALPDEDQEAISVSQEDLFSRLTSLPGKKILFIDACYAGDAANAFRRNIAGFMNAIQNGPVLNVIAYAATDSGELSRECDKQENGCYTEALLAAFADWHAAALFGAQDRIDTEELRRYVREQTGLLTDGRQKPVMIRSHPNFADFELFSLQ